VGTYAELELVVDEAEVEPAKAHIASLAAALGLSGSERRSYLELFLKRGSPV
jgi:adenylate cyclase class IV